MSSTSEGRHLRQGEAKSRQKPCPADDFVRSLSNEERMLVVLKRELYQGSWAEMEADLQARLEGRPYIFKLAHRITDDLRRIEKLRKFEQAQKVDLGDYVRSEEPPGGTENL